MAISNILPAQNSVIRPGESFSFDILNGYTSLVVKVVQSSGEEYAYDFALGGAQAGYTVSLNGVHKILVYVNTTVHVSLTHFLVYYLWDIAIFKKKSVLTFTEVNI